MVLIPLQQDPADVGSSSRMSQAQCIWLPRIGKYRFQTVSKFAQTSTPSGKVNVTSSWKTTKIER
eukprot:4805807-Amphidinium_carterae.1